MVKFAVGIGSGRRFHGIFGEKGRRFRGIGSGVGGPRPADARSLPHEQRQTTDVRRSTYERSDLARVIGWVWWVPGCVQGGPGLEPIFRTSACETAPLSISSGFF